MKAVASAVTIFAVFATGCANPYTQFFTPAGQVIPADRIDVSAAATPVVYTYTANPEADNRLMVESGFVYVGGSSFNSGQRVTRSQIMEQAKKVHAAVVLVSSKYAGSVTGSIPFTTYKPGQIVTSRTSGTVNVYSNTGGAAYGTYSGATTTQLPGHSSTTYIPYTINRFDYAASFWAKAKPGRLGVYVDDLPWDVRKPLERNTGVVVRVVLNGSPAFRANILEDDVVIALNGTEVINAQHFGVVLDSAPNDTTLSIIRGGEMKSIVLKLDSVEAPKIANTPK